jgi:hypothetical protein
MTTNAYVVVRVIPESPIDGAAFSTQFASTDGVSVGSFGPRPAGWPHDGASTDTQRGFAPSFNGYRSETSVRG